MIIMNRFSPLYIKLCIVINCTYFALSESMNEKEELNLSLQEKTWRFVVWAAIIHTAYHRPIL